MNKKLRQDERGIAHVLLIVLVIVVIAAAGAVGWEVMKSNKKSPAAAATSSTGSTTASSAAADTSCLAAYHDAVLCKFAANSTSLEQTDYTATITSVQSGTTSTFTLENDGKGNTELTSTGNGQTLNAITLNGTTYVQTTSGGSWIEYPSGTSAPTNNPASNMNIGVGSSGITYKALGTAVCGSLTCYKYEVLDSATPNATQYALFDTGSYKLREWQYSDGSGNTDDMTITYGTVTITTPSPVESLSSLGE